MGYKPELSKGMNMIMVNASTLASRSFGTPWRSKKDDELTPLIMFGLGPVPIVPACETKLFII